jgi:hypothetical protein
MRHICLFKWTLLWGALAFVMPAEAMNRMNSHFLSGCWEGVARVDYKVDKSQLNCSSWSVAFGVKDKSLALSLNWVCENDFRPLWDDREFELRKGREIWGGSREKALIGWLNEKALYVEDSLSSTVWNEWNVSWDEELQVLKYSEKFIQGGQEFWVIEALLHPADASVCE